MIGIYKITNKVNNKCYIGQSINIQRRWYQEKNKAFNENDTAYNQLLSKAFRKYGLDNFTFEVLEELAPEQLNEREEYWINHFNSLTPRGYNTHKGGRYTYQPNPTTNSMLTLEEVVEIKQLLRYTEIPMSHIANEYKISLSAINAIAKGRSWQDKKDVYPLRASENYQKEIGQYTREGQLVAIYPSVSIAAKETGINISSISKICRTRGETDRKTAGRYMWRYIDDLDNPEQIEPIQYKCANQDGKHYHENITARGKEIDQYTKDDQLIATYSCMKDAAEATGIALKNISAVICGKNKTAGGYKWKAH